MSVVIKVDGLGKSYRLGTFGKQSFMGDLFGGKKQDDSNLFWALKDVSFDVMDGEVLGIIGKNGAGKSTMLKLLSRITAPTVGSVKIKGRVASLLEVGTGFHPELSGRENVFLNGAILGMRRAEIASKFDEIVAFSGVEKFIDTPVKRYSSGMYVRLAFAVAAHLEPEVLIIDEVLAVGDAEFQKKCLGKMGEVAKGGRTVLFVSHNMQAVQSLCKQTILLEGGTMTEKGPSQTVISNYLSRTTKAVSGQYWATPEEAPGAEGVKMKSVDLVLPQGAEFVDVTTPFGIKVNFWNQGGTRKLNLVVRLYTMAGECIFNTVSECHEFENGEIEGVCKVPGDLLNYGVYSIMAIVVKDTSRELFELPDAIQFEVHDKRANQSWFGDWPGLVRPKMEFGLKKIN